MCASRSASDSSRIVGSRPTSCGGLASGASLAVPSGVGASDTSSNFVRSWSKPALGLVDFRHWVIFECADPVIS
eukprot:2739414-Pyramimonas_sp.AAC.1